MEINKFQRLSNLTIFRVQMSITYCYGIAPNLKNIIVIGSKKTLMSKTFGELLNQLILKKKKNRASF